VIEPPEPEHTPRTLGDTTQAGDWASTPAATDEASLARRLQGLAGRDMVGYRIGPYEIQAQLGRGGMGVVYRARAVSGPGSEGPSQSVALKAVLAGLDADDTDRRRFAREVDAVRKLSHPNLVRILDHGEDEALPWIAFELLAGPTLTSRLRQLEVSALVRVLAKVARGLGAAHAQGIVHRDVKPDNVLLRDGEADPEQLEPVVADFGLARDLTRSSSLTASGHALGTPSYMAPEQLSGAQASPATDVYAVGVMLYEGLAGERPFQRASTPAALLTSLLTRDPEPPSRRSPGVPADLERVCLKALSRDPADRYQDGDELARDLDAFLAGAPVQAGRRSRWVAPALLLIPLLAAGGILAAAFGGAAFDLGGEPGADELIEVAGGPGPSPSAEVGPPAWFLHLPEDRRPSLPLPDGLEFGEGPGEYRATRDGSVLVYVPAGPFRMGSQERDPRDRGALPTPLREVELPACFLGKYEVTAGQFEAFVRATSYQTLAEERGVSNGLDEEGAWRLQPGLSWLYPTAGRERVAPDQPAVHVTHADADAYCAWAGLRLPTEEEWEKAARWDPASGEARRYPWGQGEPGSLTPLVGNLADEALGRAYPAQRWLVFAAYEDGFVGAAPVGRFPDGASPWGALDMGGNAREWTATPHQGLDPADERALWILRGSTYRDHRRCAPAARRSAAPDGVSSAEDGFRVCRSAE
jgi:formylglycine-generating enzyme required for sulfatase activity